MIICVVEFTTSDYPSVALIDTELAVTELQKKYVSCLEHAVSEGVRGGATQWSCSFTYEEDDEICRMQVDTPQLVSAVALLYVEGLT